MCTKSEKIDLDNNSFYRLNKFQERKLSLLEFSEYRERLRKYEYETTDRLIPCKENAFLFRQQYRF